MRKEGTKEGKKKSEKNRKGGEAPVEEFLVKMQFPLGEKDTEGSFRREIRTGGNLP